MSPDMSPYFDTLIKLVLPEEIFNYFKIIEIVQSPQGEVHVHLDELDNKPPGYEQEKLISKGFHTPITIQDFPLRDKPLYLHIRRRRWTVESTGNIISREWQTVAEGTRLTKGFATFLKGLFRQLPDK
jgi:aspartyl/asparaginyl-tRNA synthetase